MSRTTTGRDAGAGEGSAPAVTTPTGTAPTGTAKPAPSAAPAPLTISQLAAYVGVTVRAIRHYHQRGLLPEPERDVSGYRRYGTQAVLDLIRIKVLGEAGVPLARVDELLAAEPATLAESVARIDADLQQQIEELQRRREHLAGLVGGDRLFVPAPLADYLDEMREVGISQHAVEVERDGWILMFARYPQRALGWLSRKRKDLTDPEYRRIYLGYDQASGWDPTDPRLAELADAMVRYSPAGPDPGEAEGGQDEVSQIYDLDDETLVALLGSHFGSTSSPALERLYELVHERQEQLGAHGSGEPA